MAAAGAACITISSSSDDDEKTMEWEAHLKLAHPADLQGDRSLSPTPPIRLDSIQLSL